MAKKFPSPSKRFRGSLSEVHRLMEIHTLLTGTGPGRRHQVEVLNKSAVLFACAAFEAFIETLAEGAFTKIVEYTTDHSKLPKQIRKSVAKFLKGNPNEIKIWDLAGIGWKNACEDYRKGVMAKNISSFNTPKPNKIDDLFKELLGLQDLSKEWRWQGISADKAKKKLERFVELRGALAHGENPPPRVLKKDVEKIIAFLEPLSVRASNHVRDYCHKISGKWPWPLARLQSVK